MKYKIDKHPPKYDPVVEAYTTRRIRELKGERAHSFTDEPMHPHIRKYLDDLKIKATKE